jgi:hypothetical protein
MRPASQYKLYLKANARNKLELWVGGELKREVHGENVRKLLQYLVDKTPDGRPITYREIAEDAFRKSGDTTDVTRDVRKALRALRRGLFDDDASWDEKGYGTLSVKGEKVLQLGKRGASELTLWLPVNDPDVYIDGYIGSIDPAPDAKPEHPDMCADLAAEPVGTRLHASGAAAGGDPHGAAAGAAAATFGDGPLMTRSGSGRKEADMPLQVTPREGNGREEGGLLRSAALPVGHHRGRELLSYELARDIAQESRPEEKPRSEPPKAQTADDYRLAALRRAPGIRAFLAFVNLLGLAACVFAIVGLRDLGISWMFLIGELFFLGFSLCLHLALKGSPSFQWVFPFAQQVAVAAQSAQPWVKPHRRWHPMSSSPRRGAGRRRR